MMELTRQMVEALRANREAAEAALARELVVRDYIDLYPGVDWVEWLVRVVPQIIVQSDRCIPFAPYHHEFWTWAFGITKAEALQPLIAVWSRDTGKSTAAEAACVYVGGEGLRRYGLYVSGAQSQADDHVNNVAALLESRSVGARYPLLAQRSVNQYGQSKGWRINRLRTAQGFTLDAIGLDKAVRGARLEDQRPDFIVLDDLDDDHDSPRVVEHKINLLTRSILPAGDRRTLAILMVQNLVHDDSIVARILDKRTDLLSDAIISGPHPALTDLAYETRDGKVMLTKGTPTWEGFDLAACQRWVWRFTLRAFLAECQHERGVRSGALWTAAQLDQHRVERHPSLRRVVVAVDPAASSSPQGSQTGICVVGEDGGESGYPHYYVLADLTDHHSVDAWAMSAIGAWGAYQADAIVAEANQGGDMVADVISTRAPHIKIELVKAKRGKYTRAEPVAGLSEQGRLHMVGHLMMLERQLCTPYDPDSIETTYDRMDALVWGVTWLAFGDDPAPHYDRAKSGYTPEQPEQRAALQQIAAEMVDGWTEALERGAYVRCRRSEYVFLRPLLLDCVERYGPVGDHRGLQALEQMRKYDEEYKSTS